MQRDPSPAAAPRSQAERAAHALDWSAARSAYEKLYFVITKDTLSRVHASVAFVDRWEINDLNSASGSHFGPTWIRTRPLSDGEDYLLGDARIRVRIG